MSEQIHKGSSRETTAANPAKERKKEDPIALDRVLKLFIQSFNHSQVDIPAQRDLFAHIHRLHPTWEMSDELREEVRAAAIKAIFNLFGVEKEQKDNTFFRRTFRHIHQLILKVFDQSHQSQTSKNYNRFVHDQLNDKLLGKTRQERILEQIDEELNALQKCLNGPPSLLVNSLAAAASFAQADYKYVVTRPRPSRHPNNARGKSPLHTDPHLSYLCYFGVEGHATGVPEYDSLYAEIIKDVRTAMQQGALKERSRAHQAISGVRDVVLAYYATHPIPQEAQSFYDELVAWQFVPLEETMETP